MKIYGGYSIKQKQSIDLIKQGIDDHLSEFSDYISYNVKVEKTGVDNCFEILLRGRTGIAWKYTVLLRNNYVNEALHVLDSYTNLTRGGEAFEKFSEFFGYIKNTGWRNILSNYFNYLNSDLNSTIKYLKRIEGKDLWVKCDSICYNSEYQGYSWATDTYIKIVHIEDDVVDFVPFAQGYVTVSSDSITETNEDTCNIYDIQLSNPIETLRAEELLDSDMDTKISKRLW